MMCDSGSILSRRMGVGLICSLIVIVSLASPPLLQAKPRPAGPPWPESSLNRLTFDVIPNGSTLSTPASVASMAETLGMVESWSGHSLSSTLIRPSSIVLPLYSPQQQLLFSPNQGSVRFWFRPSADAFAKGSAMGDNYGTLLEFGIPQQSVLWFLSLDRNLNKIGLYSQSQPGADTIFEANAHWTPGEWHLLTLVYGPEGTRFYLRNRSLCPG